MKRLLLIFATVLLMSLGAFGVWYTSLNKENVDSSRWLSRSFDAVRSIHVQCGDGSYMLKALPVGWEAHVPGASWNVEAKVVPAKVEEYLARLSKLTPIRSVGGFDRGGKEEYGLHEPGLKVIIAIGDKDEETLTVRMAADEHGRVFGWSSDSPGLVYEFGKQAMEQLDLSATYFLDRRVFNFDEEQVRKVQLKQIFGSSWLVENRKDGYFFTLPGYLKEKPASDSELKLYIHSLALLRAGKLVLEPKVADKRIPALTIKVWAGKDEEPSRVDFYAIKDNPEVFLGKSTWLTVPFTLNVESVAQLLRSAFDVQGRSVVKLDTGTVFRLIVEHGDTNYAVVRGDGSWRMLGTEKELQGIDMFLWRFTELKFEALPLNNLPDTAVMLMHCKLADENGDKLTEVTFYADPTLPQGQCWMKNGGELYYPVSSRLLKDLQGMFPVVDPSGDKGPGDNS